MIKAKEKTGAKKTIVALCCSTGGPRALQEIIPKLPANFHTPVVLVQHMPDGFTKTLAQRLNTLSSITVSEAMEGDELQSGHVYIAKAGVHLKIANRNSKHYITFDSAPPREGVRPCANYLYESLIQSDYDRIICVVLTGMGADGTEGIMKLSEKKEISLIVQDEETSVVYGMPGNILRKKLPCQIVKLDQIADVIMKETEG